MKKRFDWSVEKNLSLQKERFVSFELVITIIEDGKNLLDIIKHKNETKYPNQKMFIIDIDGYIYLVPFVEDDEKIFLKTIIPSRKATKDYLLNK